MLPRCPKCGREMWLINFGDRRKAYTCNCQYVRPQWPTLEQAALQRREHVRGLTWSGFDFLETRGWA